MLSKIKRVKGLGLVFSDYTWNDGLAAFKNVNLVYGWNGCGKTTLTRLFDHLGGSREEGVEFELETSTGELVTQSDGFEHPVRVFNQHYIQRNLRVLEAQAERIAVILGEESQDLLDKIAANELVLNGVPGDPEKPGLIFQLRLDQQQLGREATRYDRLFTEAARSIGLAGSRRSYRSPNAKDDFSALESSTVLSRDELETKLGILRQDELEEIPLVRWPLVASSGDNSRSAREETTHDVAASIAAEAVPLGSLIPEAVVLARLAENPDIAEWVEHGRRLHEQHDSSVCEYCGGAFSPTRIRELALHFSGEDEALKAQLDTLTTASRALYAALDRWDVPDGARLYPDLRERYSEAEGLFRAAQAALLTEVTAIGKALVRKRSATQSVVTMPNAPNVAGLQFALDSLNEVLHHHSERTRAFAKVKNEAFSDVKKHYLSDIMEEVKALSSSQAMLEGSIKQSEADIQALKEELASYRSRVSSAHKACDLLNKHLESFLGRAELRFRPEPLDEPEVTAFGIYRGDQPATHLSEGEKTAIAFTYFVVHLADGNVAPGQGIVVIDDPISSLDTNSLYQAFAFLKGAVRETLQVFVFTHSFDFLKLLLNWRNYDKPRTGYYMLTNKIVAGARRAEIAPMDRVLRDHETEYHYLFKRLKQLQSEQDGTITAAYPVPNMARKLWDSFLMFRVPNSGSPHAKSEVLKAAGYDAQKLDAIYKFTNDQSHITGAGFDPSLVPETLNALAAIFEMMQACAPEHYAILDASIQ
ncbi:MAG: AAA family ATPase [Devosia sp.]